MPPRRRKDTPPPATGGSEKEVLVGFLDYLRASAVAKLDGGSEVDARAAAVPSGTSLLGVVRHLTFVERFFFLGEDAADKVVSSLVFHQLPMAEKRAGLAPTTRPWHRCRRRTAARCPRPARSSTPTPISPRRRPGRADVAPPRRCGGR